MAECSDSDHEATEASTSGIVQDKQENEDLKTKELPVVVKTYFSTVKADDGNFIEAFCDLCTPAKKVIRGQYKAPSNFAKHIKVNVDH